MSDHSNLHQFIYGDARPDAPDLAPRGRYRVGVRTIKAINPDQLDILKYSASNPSPRYDRPLTLEIWYPAKIPAGQQELTTYSDVLGSGPGDPARPNTPFEFQGRALRQAEPDGSRKPYPLVIVSHGYPGSRVLLTYLTENLASKGYVVIAIDHFESTHGDKAGFASTLLNRPLDDLFVLNEIGRLGSPGSGSFLAGLVDTNRTALIGYSMGGYGALNAAGAGFSREGAELPWGVPGGKLSARQSGNPEYLARLDPRIQAVVLLAPWGYPYFFDEEGLEGLKTPSFFIVGSMDDTSGFHNVKALFEGAVNSDRYLLVYQNGGHEIAVNPPPPASFASFPDYMHYQEPSWDNARCNNINQHFITAFLEKYLKNLDMSSYFDVSTPVANEARWSQNEDGSFKEDHSYWKGFRQWTLVGLELHHLSPQMSE